MDRFSTITNLTLPPSESSSMASHIPPPPVTTSQQGSWADTGPICCDSERDNGQGSLFYCVIS
ncbi:hypothetical protein BDW22DRAFT_1359463 [Trametopsis cervina]|nr:hypothetical protein BDW22DRAFT_1359463 [Trametopsis cervina]